MKKNRKTILLTRPAAQSHDWQLVLEQAGFSVICFPTIAILAEPGWLAVDGLTLQQYAQAEDWIFVSVNAVEYGLNPFERLAITHLRWPRLIAIGDQTAKALRSRGLKPAVVSTPPHSSEQLLTDPALQQVAGRKILIFSAPGGRTWLSDALQARGAVVKSLFVYRRVCPTSDPALLIEQLTAGLISVTLITSVTGLDHLQKLLGKASHLIEAIPLLVTSRRIAEVAKQRGFNRIWIAPGTCVEDVITCLHEESHS